MDLVFNALEQMATARHVDDSFCGVVEEFYKDIGAPNEAMEYVSSFQEAFRFLDTLVTVRHAASEDKDIYDIEKNDAMVKIAQANEDVLQAKKRADESAAEVQVVEAKAICHLSALRDAQSSLRSALQAKFIEASMGQSSKAFCAMEHALQTDEDYIVSRHVYQLAQESLPCKSEAFGKVMALKAKVYANARERSRQAANLDIPKFSDLKDLQEGYFQIQDRRVVEAHVAVDESNRRYEEEAATNVKLEQEVESLRGELEALKITVKVEQVARSVQGQLNSLPGDVDMKQDDTTNDVPMEVELPVSEAAMQVEPPVPEALVEEPPASTEPAQDLAEFYASIGVVSQLGQRMQPPFEPTSTFKRLDPTSVTRLAREVANGHTLAHKPLHPFAAKKLELNRYITQVEKTLGALQGQMSFSMLEVCKMWKEMQTANAKPEKAKPVKAKPEKAAQVEDKPLVKPEVINTDVIRKAVEEGVQKALATSSLVGAASSSSGAASSSLGVVGSLTWHGGLVDKIPKTMTDLELRYSANNLVVNAIQVEQKSMIARCKAEKDAAKAAKKQQMEARRLQKQIETNAAGKLTKAQLVAKVVDLEAELKKVRIELGSFEGLVQLHQAMYPDLLNIGKNDSGDEKVFESDSSVSDHSDSSDSNDSNTD